MTIKHFILPATLLAVAAIALVPGCSIYEKPPQKVDFAVKPSPALVQRGRHMTILMCKPCHYDTATKALTGMRMHDIPAIAGKVYSRNITRDEKAGIAVYSDAELAYLLRTGVARDGRLMPYMQHPLLSDDDLKAVIAFLRSDDPLVAPSKVEPPTTRYTLLGKAGLRKSSPPLDYPAHEIFGPPAGDDAALGRYLLFNMDCYDCHSASFMKINRTEPEKSKGYMAGGTAMKNGHGEKLRGPNLTFDETGLAGWTAADFAEAVRHGNSKKRGILHPPMPRYDELSEKEAHAIYTYLKTLPPVKNKVKQHDEDDRASQATGK